MTTTIILPAAAITALDLTPAQTVLQPWITSKTLLEHEQELRFQIQYPQEPEDEREFPEIAEIRLWFIRLDTVYPWLPLLLDWRSGELARYAAMLVPHQFSRQEGIQYNPQALDIFLMGKVFVLEAWLRQQGVSSDGKLRSMAELFGYELDSDLFGLLRTSHH